MNARGIVEVSQEETGYVIVLSVGGMMVQWLAFMHHIKMELAYISSQGLLQCEICVFSFVI